MLLSVELEAPSAVKSQSMARNTEDFMGRMSPRASWVTAHVRTVRQLRQAFRRVRCAVPRGTMCHECGG